MARAFPNATVYVHEKGARHLADPTRLVDSAAQVYGDLLDSLYGRLDPTPAERIHVLADGEEIEIGAGPHPDHRRLARPRQAPPGAARLRQRHPVRRRRRRRAPARRRRAPAVDPAARLRPGPGAALAAASFAARRPTGIALAHYGLVPDPSTILEEAARTPAAVGRGGRAGVAGRATTSPRRSTRALRPPTSTASSRRDNARSWRPSTASTPTPPASGAGSTRASPTHAAQPH